MGRENWTSVVEEFFQKSFHGEIEEAIGSLDPEVTYDVSMPHPLAGHFTGPQAVAQHLSELLATSAHTVNVLQWEDWMVGVNHIAVLIRLRMQVSMTVHTYRSIILVGMSVEDKIRSVEAFFYT